MGALGTFGYFDWPNWVASDGNVGRLGTDFSQFEVFQRGVIIIKVKYTGVDNRVLTGYVASIPVGLDTIGSVVLDPSTVVGSVLKKGYSRLGNFLYGGSLNILLFSRGLASPVVQTRLGNQITILNTQETLAE
jgi:phosphatidylserine decarboxylase